MQTFNNDNNNGGGAAAGGGSIAATRGTGRFDIHSVQLLQLLNHLRMPTTREALNAAQRYPRGAAAAGVVGAAGLVAAYKFLLPSLFNNL